MIVHRFQVEVVGGTGELHAITINVQARVHKDSDAALVALGQSINITSHMLDASRLAWLTGTAAIT